MRLRATTKSLEKARPTEDAPDLPTLTLYTRTGCHLCDEMKAVVQAVSRRVPLTVQEIDVASDRELEDRYGHEVPVLLVDGRKVAKYRITEERLLRLVSRSTSP